MLQLSASYLAIASTGSGVAQVEGVYVAASLMPPIGYSQSLTGTYSSHIFHPLVADHQAFTGTHVQYVYPAPPTWEDIYGGPPMGANSILPLHTFRGLTFDDVSRPIFSTSVQEHVGGQETSNAFWQMPKWEFELSFDYLPDRKNDALSDKKRLLGFFMSRKGRFDYFLYRNPSDHSTVDELVGIGDGLTSEWPLVRSFGDFREYIGYAKTDSVVLTQTTGSTGVIPASPFSVVLYGRNIIEVSSLQYQATDGSWVNLTRIPSGTPSTGQYYLNDDTGQLIFAAAQTGRPYQISYTFHPVQGHHYIISLPRTVKYLSTPPAGDLITGSYDFYFVCRFTEDQVSVDQFVYNLYDLDRLVMRSVVL
jgi:hypothetical protein